MESMYSQQTFQIADTSYWIGPYNDSFALISKNGVMGLINRNGEMIVEPKYDRIFSFHNGVAIVCKNNKYGIISSKGQEVLSPTLEFIFDFEESDVAWFYKIENGQQREGLIDKNGQIIELPEKTVFRKIKNQYLATTTEGHTLLSSGRVPIVKVDYSPFEQLEKNHPFLLNMDPWLSCSESDKTESGKRDYWKRVIETPKEIPKELVFFFSEGLAILPKNVNGKLKFCYINPDGKEVIAPKYDRAQLFEFGLAAVMQNNKWGIINTKGEMILPFNYEYLEVLDGNYFLYKVGGKSGVIDKSQEVIIKPEYASIGYIIDDIFALLPYTPDIENFIRTFNPTEPCYQIDNWGAIHVKTGQQILPFEYHHVKKINSSTGLGIKYIVDVVNDKSEDSIKAIIRRTSSAISYNNYLVSAKQSVFNKKQAVFDYTSEPELQTYVTQANLKNASELQPVALSSEQLFFHTGKEWLNEKGQQVTDQLLIKQLEFQTNQSQLKILTQGTGSKSGVETLKGEVIINPEYDEVKICYSGIILGKNGKFGFADLAGKLIVPLHYDKMTELPSGCLEAVINKKIVLVDKTGKTLTEN